MADGIRNMVQTINKVGVKRISDYCDKYRPRMNFKRQLAVIRAVAQKGYTYASYEFGISKQAAEQSLKRMHCIALQIQMNSDREKET